MGAPNFGIDIRRVDEEPRPVIRADLSTIGIIGPADEADVHFFPLNDPVFLNSNRLRDIKKLGEAGLIPDAIRGINDQLGETQFAARIVIVRTATGIDNDPAVKMQKTINNIAGNSLQGTGIFAFLKSAHKLGFTPRVILCPGYTGQMANGIGDITRTVPGKGYAQDMEYMLEFTLGGPDAVQATAHAYGLSDGSLGMAELITPGAWYDPDEVPTLTAPAPGQQVTDATVFGGGTGHQIGDQITLGDGVMVQVATIGPNGEILTVTIIEAGWVDTYVGAPLPTANPVPQLGTSGTGLQSSFDLTWEDVTTGPVGTTAEYTVDTLSIGANPIVANLTSVLNQLIGHAIVESTGTSFQNDIDWRETMQSQRIIPLSGGVRVMDPVSSYVVFRPLAPRMAGILIRRDHETGAPFHSAANQPVQGIIAPGRDIPFALTDDANEAQELLGFNIGCVVRGQIGDDFAIASGGFVLISTDNAGEDELWRFYNVMRGRDYIHLGMLRALRFFLGRYNIVGHTIRAILNTMGFFLRDLKAEGHILGYRMTFKPEGNSAEEIRKGHLTVGFKAEEPPPLKRITIESARYRDAIDTMINDLASQLNLATG